MLFAMTYCFNTLICQHLLIMRIPFFVPDRKFSHAIDLYTQAIELNGRNAVYFANRAFAHLRLEEYGSAIQDATQAIEVDPKYSKVLQFLKL